MLRDFHGNVSNIDTATHTILDLCPPISYFLLLHYLAPSE
jgi:hypothetical protein